MFTKRFSAMLLVIALFAVSAFAQPRRCPDGAICVSKNMMSQANPNGDEAQFTTIQAAVNSARPGQVIEILDTSVYVEQVNILGNANPGPTDDWPASLGIPGGKNGITIRYTPGPPYAATNGWGANGPLAGGHPRPTIFHRDVSNTSPVNSSQASQEGLLPGYSGNWHTNGALRIIAAQNITIEGVRVDGGSPFPFNNGGFWGGDGVTHGNAGIVLKHSGSVIIRNTEVINAAHGIYVCDRNIGGIYANRNEHDNISSVPLAAYGKMGNHIFEYNRIHRNNVGMNFHSVWDLGSTIRFNLIFDNYIYQAWSAGSGDQRRGGGIRTRDMRFTPLTIYNNTFYNNKVHVEGAWQSGTQHLQFNNIYGQTTGNQGGPDPANDCGNDANHIRCFTQTMHASVMSGTPGPQQQQPQNYQYHQWANCGEYYNPRTQQWGWPAAGLGDCTAYPDALFPEIRNACAAEFPRPQAPGGGSVGRVQLGQNWEIQGTGITVPPPVGTHSVPAPGGGTTPVPCHLFIQNASSATVQAVAPGQVITNYTSGTVRWLQVDGNATYGLPLLFQSTNPNAPNFLHPTWSGSGMGSPQAQELVGEFIERQGWQSAVAPGGQRPDLGAIQKSGWQPTVTARIHSPFPVLVANNASPTVPNPTLALNFHLTVENELGQNVTLENPEIMTMRWVTVSGTGVVSGVTNVTPTPGVNIISNGSTAFNQQFSGTLPQEPNIGYYEIVVRGTVNGQTVVSNVGILPYRLLQHRIVMEVYTPGGMTPLDQVTAGQNVELRVTLRGPVGIDAANLPPLRIVNYELQSGVTADMWCGQHFPAGGGSPGIGRCTPPAVQNLPGVYARRPDLTGRPLRQDGGILGFGNPQQVSYPIFFTVAGNETIFAAGTACQGNFNPTTGACQGTELAFLGMNNIKVLPGEPERVGFKSPMSRSQLEDPFGGGACRRPGEDGGPGPGTCLAAQTINRGMNYNVEVEVQDRFENLVTTPPARVDISSHDPNIGDVGDRTNFAQKFTMTNSEGIAEFHARVTRGNQFDMFDMTALLPQHANPASTRDIARLRVGRPLSALLVFYSDGFQYTPTGDTLFASPGVPAVNQNPMWEDYWDDMREINEQISETRHMIIIKAASPDGVLTTWGDGTDGGRWVQVIPEEPEAGSLVHLWATPTGGEPTNTFQVQPGGYAVAWIGPNTARTSDINTAVAVFPCRSADCSLQDTDLEGGWRGNIRFYPSDMSVRYGVMFGDGNGRPDSLRIRFEDQADGDIRGFLEQGGIPAPSSVSFFWPTADTATYERWQRINITTAQGPTVTTGCFNFEIGGFTLNVNFAACNVTVTDRHGNPVPGGAAAIHTGYTSIPNTAGANRIASLTLRPVEEGGEGRVFSGFPVHDGIGPIIALTDEGIPGRRNPGIVENLNSCGVSNVEGCEQDVLRVQLTEGIRRGLVGADGDRPAFATNNIIQMLTLSTGANPNVPYNTGAAAENLIIESVGLRGGAGAGTNEFWLTLAANSPAPRLEDGASPNSTFWIRLNPASTNGLEDFAQSGTDWPDNMQPHAQNRWVQVGLIPTPPAIVPGAWYTSDDKTGFLDTAVVVFNKPGNIMEWLAGGSLRLGTDNANMRTIVFPDDLGPNIRWQGAGGRDSILVINLQWLYGSRRGQVMTAGLPQLTITFSDGMGWEPQVTSLTDRANPVLASDQDNSTDNPRVALLSFSPLGDNDQPIGFDTLRVRFSEPVNYDGRTYILQLHVHSNGQVIPLPIGDRHIRTVGAGGQWIESTFELDPSVLAGVNLTSGLDSLRIIPGEITDQGGNMQEHPENRAVPLVLDYKSNWTDIAKNNPGRNDPDRRFELVINRGIGNVAQEFTAEFVLYNNMGNVVLREKIDVQTDPERARGSSLVWSWDGRNHRGRLVGTGTYLLRANIISDVITDGGKVDMAQRDTHTINRLIGFVR